MANRTPLAIDLAAFANEHLRYEGDMFALARNRLFQGAKPGFETNVLIEACVLHLRNLIGFFYPKNVEPDDVVAANYAPSWDRQRPPISSGLWAAYDRMNKELAHLTTMRKFGSPPDKKWDFTQLSAAMKPVIECFIPLAGPGLPHEAATALNGIADVPVILAAGPPVFNSTAAGRS
jgi:hypothetical protein